MNQFQGPEYSIPAINELVRSNCHPDTTALFIYLPKPPKSNENLDRVYLEQLNLLTNSLPPTLLAHGLHEVTSTAL